MAGFACVPDEEFDELLLEVLLELDDELELELLTPGISLTVISELPWLW